MAKEYCCGIVQTAGQSCCDRTEWGVLDVVLQLDSLSVGYILTIRTLNSGLCVIRLTPNLPKGNCSSVGVVCILSQIIY